MATRQFSLAVVLLAVTIVCLTDTRNCHAQALGIELHNTVMPASGGMGGASIARPQDLQSALNGNPATIAQFEGTQFSMNGSWIEPTLNVNHLGGALPNVTAFSGKSESEGAMLGNIGVVQDLRALGIPATVGMALIGSSGAGVSFRDVPESNGTSALFQVLQTTVGVGVDLTDRLSMGANMMLGAGTLDGPFVGIGAAATDYALRGALGIDYDIGCHTTLGLYYQTTQDFNFDDAMRLALPAGGFSTALDLDVGIPDNIGFGFANDRLMNGRLLTAVDVLFKQWDNADFFDALYENQWVVQLGTQYRLNSHIRLRAGYVFAENITQSPPGVAAGGITPPAFPAGIQYVQAQFPAINQHRISGGIGIRDLLPGVDLDLFAGGMFRESQQYGAFTSTNLESYWVGFGTTWRFGRGSCRRLPVPDRW